MAGNTITSDEVSQFKSLPVKKKVDSMDLYLRGDGRKYTMQEVGARIFGNENYSYSVSLIHRCYNFSGQNGGKYRNGCKFEQTYRYRVTRADIEAFVRAYPDGTFRNGVTFEDFLRTRVGSAKVPTLNPQQQAQRSVPQEYSRQNTNNAKNNQMTNAESDKGLRIAVLIIGLIGVLILFIMFSTGVLFDHWIIALIILFWTCSAFFTVIES